MYNNPLCLMLGLLSGVIISTFLGGLNSYPWYVDFIVCSVVVYAILILLSIVLNLD